MNYLYIYVTIIYICIVTLLYISNYKIISFFVKKLTFSTLHLDEYSYMKYTNKKKSGSQTQDLFVLKIEFYLIHTLQYFWIWSTFHLSSWFIIQNVYNLIMLDVSNTYLLKFLEYILQDTFYAISHKRFQYINETNVHFMKKYYIYIVYLKNIFYIIDSNW